MQFSCLGAVSAPYVIFNADLTRTRNTNHGRAGSALPDGQFRISKKYHFYKFWQATGLPMPKLSSFHDRMGALKSILFSGVFVKGERLRADSIRPINLTCEQIKDAVFNADNSRTICGQQPDNNQTRLPDKELTENQSVPAFQPLSTTGSSNYGVSKQGSTEIRGNVTPINVTSKSPMEQSREEWLAAYDSTK